MAMPQIGLSEIPGEVKLPSVPQNKSSALEPQVNTLVHKMRDLDESSSIKFNTNCNVIATGGKDPLKVTINSQVLSPRPSIEYLHRQLGLLDKSQEELKSTQARMLSPRDKVNYPR